VLGIQVSYAETENIKAAAETQFTAIINPQFQDFDTKKLEQEIIHYFIFIILELHRMNAITNVTQKPKMYLTSHKNILIRTEIVIPNQ